MSGNLWYYAENNQQQGPVSEDDLKHLLDSGRLAMTTLVWSKNLSGWTPASDLECFTAKAEAPNPVPQPVANIPQAQPDGDMNRQPSSRLRQIMQQNRSAQPLSADHNPSPSPAAGKYGDLDAIPTPGSKYGDLDAIPTPGSNYGDLDAIPTPGSKYGNLDSIPTPGQAAPNQATEANLTPEYDGSQTLDRPVSVYGDLDAIPTPSAKPAAPEPKPQPKEFPRSGLGSPQGEGAKPSFVNPNPDADRSQKASFSRSRPGVRNNVEPEAASSPLQKLLDSIKSLFGKR